MLLRYTRHEAQVLVYLMLDNAMKLFYSIINFQCVCVRSCARACWLECVRACARARVCVCVCVYLDTSNIATKKILLT